MNTDKNSQDHQTNYYALMDEVQAASISSKEKPHLNDQQNLNRPLLNTPQQVQHNYQPYHQDQHQNLYSNQNQNPQHINHAVHPQNLSDNLRYQNHQNRPPLLNIRDQLIQQAVIYKNRFESHIVNKKPLPTQIISILTDKHDSIKNGQNFPCQRCGLKAIGPISLVSGQKAIGWGTCLFFFTGMFCFIPCFTNSCKDAHISCARCGYKKAIVRAKCCS